MTDKFFNSRGLLGPHGENDIVFTAEYYALLLLTNPSKRQMLKENFVFDLYKSLESLRIKEGAFQSDDLDESWSHDNHTALISISQIYNLDYHEKFFWKGWQRRIHPRDLIFYIHSLGGFRGFLALPFIPILSIIMLIGALPSHKIIDEQRILATDGKLLSWLRLQTGNYPLTQRLYNCIIKQYYGSWSTIFNTYFREVNHPNRIYSERIYGGINE